MENQHIHPLSGQMVKTKTIEGVVKFGYRDLRASGTNDYQGFDMIVIEDLEGKLHHIFPREIDAIIQQDRKYKKDHVYILPDTSCEYRPQIYDIEKAIKSINADIYAQSGEEDKYSVLYYQGNGDNYWVKFADYTLWSIQDDERYYDEKTDSYEPIEDCLRRLLMREIETVKKINLTKKRKSTS